MGVRQKCFNHSGSKAAIRALNCRNYHPDTQEQRSRSQVHTTTAHRIAAKRIGTYAWAHDRRAVYAQLKVCFIERWQSGLLRRTTGVLPMDGRRNIAPRMFESFPLSNMALLAEGLGAGLWFLFTWVRTPQSTPKIGPLVITVSTVALQASGGSSILPGSTKSEGICTWPASFNNN